MDTHWQISVPDPGHRQVFLDLIVRKYRKYLRVASLNCTKGYGNIVKVILDSLRNAVDTVTPIWNRFWFRPFLNSFLTSFRNFVVIKTTKDTLLSTRNNDDILFYRNHWFIYNRLFRYWCVWKTVIKSYIAYFKDRTCVMASLAYFILGILVLAAVSTSAYFIKHGSFEPGMPQRKFR